MNALQRLGHAVLRTLGRDARAAASTSPPATGVCAVLTAEERERQMAQIEYLRGLLDILAPLPERHVMRSWLDEPRSMGSDPQYCMLPGNSWNMDYWAQRGKYAPAGCDRAHGSSHAWPQA